MRNVKILLLLSWLGFTANSCKFLSGNKGCENFEDSVPPFLIRFSLGVAGDSTGANYFEVNEGYTYQNFRVYDQNWQPAFWNASKVTWDQLGYSVPIENYIHYADDLSGKPYGVDIKKNFYMVFSRDSTNLDIDPLSLEYNVANECRNQNYFRAYYNEEMVYSENFTLSSSFLLPVKKK